MGILESETIENETPRLTINRALSYHGTDYRAEIEGSTIKTLWWADEEGIYNWLIEGYESGDFPKEVWLNKPRFNRLTSQAKKAVRGLMYVFAGPEKHDQKYFKPISSKMKKKKEQMNKKSSTDTLEILTDSINLVSLKYISKFPLSKT